jgi:hypothetical protein
MSKKFVITFSNCTEHGVESPEKIYNQSVIEYVTEILAAAAKNEGYDLDNCTAYPVQGMYKGVAESSFRLEYISDIPAAYMIGLALGIKDEYKQESVLLESYTNGEYKAQLVFDIDNIIEL